MKSFKQFIKEETMPYAVTASGSINIEDPSVLDGLNVLLAGVTNGKFVTPYIAFERVQKALANFLIFPSRPTFLEGDSGVYTAPVSQFGDKMGQDTTGNFIDSVPSDLHLFFEYRLSDCGMFVVFCEVVTEDELMEITDDLEAELSGEGEEEKLDEQKLTNRATDSKPAETTSKNDTPMKDRATTPGASTPVPSGSFSPRVPTRGTKDLDKMNRDEEGNTVVEGQVDFSKVTQDKKSGQLSTKDPKIDLSKIKMNKSTGNLSMKESKDEEGNTVVEGSYGKKKLDEISAEKVGKLASAVALGKKKLKTVAASKTLSRRHREEWLKSKVGELKK